MASTNKTTHYDLSQYIAGDKPTYLVDYNGDMSAIDTGIYNAQAKANVNESNIGDLTNLDTTVKTDLVSAINEEAGKTSKIGNLSNLTTTAKTDLVVAINEVDAEADANTTAIGTLANLETTNKTNLVGAINEVNTKTGDLSNLETTSKTDLVSAINEVLNDVKGTILWTNANPTSDFINQEVNIANLNNYDEIKVIYKNSKTSSGQKVSDNYRDDVSVVNELEFYDGANFYIRNYTLDFANNKIIFQESVIPNVAYHNETNIPIYIIGYKTGLFD